MWCRVTGYCSSNNGDNDCNIDSNDSCNNDNI